MIEPKYIAKGKYDSKSLDYDLLLQQGIDLIQQFSGNQWTDFNYHDPGITFLEQICYALTDLGYKSNFPIEDILLAYSDNFDLENNNLLIPPEEMIRTLAPELAQVERGRLHSARLPNLRHVIVMDDASEGSGVWTFTEVATLGGPAQQLRLPEIDRTLQPDDAINIQFTSGTTGQPKGATLSHYNIVNNARFVTDRIKLTENDRLAIPVPLYHCFGMVMGVLGGVSKGAALIFPGQAFDAKQTLDALATERCTALYGVPTMFVAMLQELTDASRDLSASPPPNAGLGHAPAFCPPS